MILSQVTLDVLKNFSGINQSIVIRPGKTLKTMSPGKSIIAVAEVPDEFPQSIAIYDLKEFLSVIRLFENPVLTLEEKRMVVGNGRARANYANASETGIVLPPEDFKYPDVVGSFDLKWDDFEAAMDAASALKLPELGFKTRSGQVVLCAFDMKNMGEAGNSFEMPVGTSETPFETIAIDLGNLRLMRGDYAV